MKRTWVLGVVVAWTGLLSAAGQTPFERVAIDGSVKAPWAKIIAISEMTRATTRPQAESGLTDARNRRQASS